MLVCLTYWFTSNRDYTSLAKVNLAISREFVTTNYRLQWALELKLYSIRLEAHCGIILLPFVRAVDWA